MKWPERESWIPVNLKWSAEKSFRRKCFKTIYPGGRRYLCDIGRVNGPENDKNFAFELPWPFISQDTYLPPGRYKIQISVYSKNAAKYSKKAAKVIKEFVVDWRGGWKKKHQEMQKNLKINML